MIEEAAAALQAIAGGIDKVGQDAAAAEANAQQIAARAAAQGFIGVAQGMHQVRVILQNLISQLQTSRQPYSDAARSVAAIHQKRSPQDNIAALSAGHGTIGAAITGLTGCLYTLTNAQQMTATVLLGGQPGPMLARLQEIKQLLVVLVQRSTEANKSLETALNQAKRTGRVGSANR